MPIAKCQNCKRTTNSALSNYWLDMESDEETPKSCGIATKCYAAFVDNRWVKGCAYNDISTMQQKVFNHLFKNEGTKR